jgi:hypothetical protein
MHTAGADGVDNSRAIGSDKMRCSPFHTAKMGAYRARSKGVQWSAQLLAECSGWLKCDKAKLKSTAGKELTFWFSARGMVRCKFYRQPKDRGQWPTQVAIQLCCETWRSSSCFPHPRAEVRSSVHSGERVRRAHRISLHKRNGRGRETGEVLSNSTVTQPEDFAHPEQVQVHVNV